MVEDRTDRARESAQERGTVVREENVL